MSHDGYGVAPLGLRVHPCLPNSFIIHVLSRKLKMPQAMPMSVAWPGRIGWSAVEDWSVFGQVIIGVFVKKHAMC
jgi:hypothetical protein